MRMKTGNSKTMMDEWGIDGDEEKNDTLPHQGGMMDYGDAMGKQAKTGMQ